MKLVISETIFDSGDPAFASDAIKPNLRGKGAYALKVISTLRGPPAIVMEYNCFISYFPFKNALRSISMAELFSARHYTLSRQKPELKSKFFSFFYREFYVDMRGKIM